MVRTRSLSLLLALSVLGDAFTVPTGFVRLRRGYGDNELDSTENGARDLVGASSETRVVREEDESKADLTPDDIADNFDSPSVDIPSKVNLSPSTESTSTSTSEFSTPDPFDEDDEDADFDEPMQAAPTAGGGSNIFSLLRLANVLFPGSSGGNFMWNFMRDFFLGNQAPLFWRRHDVADNEIEVDYISDLKPPPLQRQETEENDSEDSESESSEDDDNETEEDEDNAAEESIENNGSNNNGNGSKAKQDSDSNGASNGDESDYDSDEPPGGDGQGGGILGILAGLSGGEDGQSDLGSLLATFSGIIANLSGDGIDLNAIIASGIGLFVGLLSEGEENPGAVIASYLLTSLETITGGGANNNGAFFGTFLSKLIKGTSAAGEGEASSEENGNGMQMTDSNGFFLSFLMGLLGDMSKGSSGGSSAHPQQRAYMMR